MPICSYLVIPAPGTVPMLAERLASIPGCEVHRALERELLILVTETDEPGEEEALQTLLSGIPEILALVLTFGEIEMRAAPAGAG